MGFEFTDFQLWCTISKRKYDHERLWAKYIWLWLALGFSFGANLPILFFWARNKTTEAERRLFFSAIACVILLRQDSPG
jgi:hypothetical protein